MSSPTSGASNQMNSWKLDTEIPVAIAVGRVSELPPDVAIIEHNAPEVDVAGFYAQRLIVRLMKMLWGGLFWKPAMQTRALTFGKRIDFVGDPDHVAVLQNNGEIVRHDIRGGGHEVIFLDQPTRVPIHCLCSMPNSRCSIGVGTDSGPIVLRRVLRSGREPELDVMKYDDENATPVDCMDFHPSGSRFVAAGPTEAGFYVWDYVERSSRQITTGFNRITALAYSPCGNYIAALSDCRYLMIYHTLNWACFHLGARTKDGYVLSFAWSAPSIERSVLMVAFSDEPHLEICEVLVRQSRVCLHRVSLAGTSQFLASVDEPRGKVLNVKQMCWDTYGRRLAVLLDRPHPNAGHVAFFATHLTQEPEFRGYVRIIADLHFYKCVHLHNARSDDDDRERRLYASMACCYEKLKRCVKFVTYVNGEISHFTSPIDQWEMADMDGPAYRLLK